MRRFYGGVVRFRALVLILFALASLVCLGLKRLVFVNYDVNDYLPPDSPSTVSIDVMAEEFPGGR